MKRVFLSIALFVLTSVFLQGQVPSTMSYQGILADNSGVPVPDGNYNLTFRLYNTANGGSPVWEEGQLLPVSKGVFNAILGSVIPLALPFDEQYWLGISVSAGDELTPRIRLTAGAYCFIAQTVVDEGITANKIANGEITSEKLAPETFSLLPVAYGTISDGGEVYEGSSGNFTVTKVGDGHYKIDFADFNYYYTKNVTVCSVYGNDPCLISYYDAGTSLYIKTFNLAGTLENHYFNFVVYKK
ncbi:MAG: hypothetical protein V1720_03025 [bacterium]